VRKAYQRIKKLDRDLYYLSLNFELKEFEFNPNMDKLNFQVSLGGTRIILLEIDMNIYLVNELDVKAVMMYDPRKPGYLTLEPEVKLRGSVLFEKMKAFVNSEEMW
jgi:hypothetical protein